MWGRQSYRFSDLDFEANLREGIAADWPIRYKDIEPWYDYVEDFVGISGQAEGLPQLPDSKFLPPMEMTCAEHVVKDALPKNFNDGRMMTIGRAAVLTQTHRGRAACHYCGVCHRGCITRSYFSSLNSTLPAAEKTGKHDPAPLQRGAQPDLRSRHAQSYRRSRHRWPDQTSPSNFTAAFFFSTPRRWNPRAFC